MQKSVGSYVKLENQPCVEAYTDVFQNQHRNVLIVAADKGLVVEDGASRVFQHGLSFAGTQANNWICSRHQSDAVTIWNDCDTTPSGLISLPGVQKWDDWEAFDQSIHYCFSEKHKQPCALQYSPLLVGLLIMVTFLKLTRMVFILLFVLDREGQLLICPGDAAASFLQREDATTAGMCLATKRSARKLWKRPRQKVFKGRVRRSWRGASVHEWFYFLSRLV